MHTASQGGKKNVHGLHVQSEEKYIFSTECSEIPPIGLVNQPSIEFASQQLPTASICGPTLVLPGDQVPKPIIIDQRFKGRILSKPTPPEYLNGKSTDDELPPSLTLWRVKVKKMFQVYHAALFVAAIKYGYGVSVNKMNLWNCKSSQLCPSILCTYAGTKTVRCESNPQILNRQRLSAVQTMRCHPQSIRKYLPCTNQVTNLDNIIIYASSVSLAHCKKNFKTD